MESMSGRDFGQHDNPSEHEPADPEAVPALDEPINNALEPIGIVLEIAGSGSAIALDLQRLQECADDFDPSVALAGQVGQHVAHHRPQVVLRPPAPVFTGGAVVDRTWPGVGDGLTEVWCVRDLEAGHALGDLGRDLGGREGHASQVVGAALLDLLGRHRHFRLVRTLAAGRDQFAVPVTGPEVALLEDAVGAFGDLAAGQAERLVREQGVDELDGVGCSGGLAPGTPYGFGGKDSRTIWSSTAFASFVASSSASCRTASR